MDKNIKEFIRNGEIILPESYKDFPGTIVISDRNDLVTLGNLRRVLGGLYISNCINLRSIGDLTHVQGPVEFSLCPKLKSIDGLRQAFGFANLIGSSVKQVPKNFEIKTLIPGYDTLLIPA